MTEQPARIQRCRTKGWKLPRNTVIVDRTSRFGNPFRISSAMDVLGLNEAEARKAVVAAFGPWLAGSRAEWQSDDADRKRERILGSLHLLPGKNLACACGLDEQCHADTLLKWAADPELAARIESARRRVDRQRASRGEDPMYSAVVTADNVWQLLDWIDAGKPHFGPGGDGPCEIDGLTLFRAGDRHVALFGDTIVRDSAGRFTVRKAVALTP